MARRRHFPPEFKVEVLCCQSSQAELYRKHNLSDVQHSKWNRQLFENETIGVNRDSDGFTNPTTIT